jgi:hypothetical protein
MPFFFAYGVLLFSSSQKSNQKSLDSLNIIQTLVSQSEGTNSDQLPFLSGLIISFATLKDDTCDVSIS